MMCHITYWDKGSNSQVQGRTQSYDMTGWGGEPDIPFTFQFETGLGEERRTHIIPLSSIRAITYETGDPR